MTGHIDYLIYRSCKVWSEFKNEISEISDDEIRSKIEEYLNSIKDKPSHPIIDKINVTLGINKNEQEERLAISQIK